jgi:serine/threonine protein kinase
LFLLLLWSLRVIAQEVVLGGEADHRVDIYALGCGGRRLIATRSVLQITLL